MPSRFLSRGSGYQPLNPPHSEEDLPGRVSTIGDNSLLVQLEHSTDIQTIRKNTRDSFISWTTTEAAVDQTAARDLVSRHLTASWGSIGKKRSLLDTVTRTLRRTRSTIGIKDDESVRVLVPEKGSTRYFTVEITFEQGSLSRNLASTSQRERTISDPLQFSPTSPVVEESSRDSANPFQDPQFETSSSTATPSASAAFPSGSAAFPFPPMRTDSS